jgi:hypothetical protein
MPINRNNYDQFTDTPQFIESLKELQEYSTTPTYYNVANYLNNKQRVINCISCVLLNNDGQYDNNMNGIKECIAPILQRAYNPLMHTVLNIVMALLITLAVILTIVVFYAVFEYVIIPLAKCVVRVIEKTIIPFCMRITGTHPLVVARNIQNRNLHGEDEKSEVSD